MKESKQNNHGITITKMLLFPIHRTVDYIISLFKLKVEYRKLLHCILGTLLALFGVMLSKMHADSFIMHYFADFFGYFLHGFGLAPIMKVIAEAIKLDI